MTTSAKLLVLLAIGVSEAAATGFLVPRFFREGKSALAMALIASAILTVAATAVVLFVLVE